MDKYNISVFGLGYVGLVTSSCLAKIGHNIIGVDIDKQKIDALNNAKSPISEPELNNYIKQAISLNLLSATSDINKAIHNTDISFICVGTPSNQDGSCSLKYIEKLCEDIGESLKSKYINNNNTKHLILIRSTLPPGTVEQKLIPILENHSKLKNNQDFYTGFHPEFLREGIAIDDFFNPPKYIIGLDQTNPDNTNTDTIIDNLLNIYNLSSNENLIITSYKTAEMIKYTDNIWHGLKVSFANEIGTLAKNYGVDANELMSAFCKDTKLNISSYYLKPGLSYGGSCLPKEISSVKYLINQKDLDLPLLNNINISNQNHFDRVYDFLYQNINNILTNNNINKTYKISWFGLSFKENTDDLRNSIQLELVTKLLKNFDMAIHDLNIDINNLLEEQEVLLKNKINNIKQIYHNDFESLLENTDIIILGHNLDKCPYEYKNILYNIINNYSTSQKMVYIIDIANNNLDYNLLNNPQIKYIKLF